MITLSERAIRPPADAVNIRKILSIEVVPIDEDEMESIVDHFDYTILRYTLDDDDEGFPEYTLSMPDLDQQDVFCAANAAAKWAKGTRGNSTPIVGTTASWVMSMELSNSIEANELWGLMAYFTTIPTSDFFTLQGKSIKTSLSSVEGPTPFFAARSDIVDAISDTFADWPQDKELALVMPYFR